MTGIRQSCVSIGIDIGGTKIEGVAIDGSGAVIGHLQRPSRKGNRAVCEDVGTVIHELLQVVSQSGSVVAARVVVGVGVPGRVDTAAGTVEEAVNLGISRLRLGPEIERECGVRTVIDNDVNMAAVGAVARTSDEVRDAVFINFGTGLAAGVIRDGALDRGASGITGEIGHVPVHPDGVACKCGQVGCLETVASGSAVARLWPTSRRYAIPDLLDHADDGDRHAQQVLHGVVDGVITAILMVLTTLDPPVVLLGGGMLKAGARLRDAIDAELNRRERASAFLRQVDASGRIHFVPDDEPIGAIGAAVAAGRSARITGAA